MKKWGKIFALVAAVLLVLSVAAFAQPKHWVVGFSQIGSEREWRTADTISVQNAFLEDPTFTLIYSDAQQRQENQIKAIRSFIARRVNAILFTALVETGYGPVLQEAKRAGIPVVMIDRDVAKEDRGLRLTIMGSDFIKEGEKAGEWLADYLKKKGLDDGKKAINIVELQGTTGSAPAIERKTGFANVLKSHANWKITRSQTGNFTSSEGKQVMEAFLKADKNIDVLYAHNDQMALGAIQAIKEAGLKPGKDIIIVGVDAVKGAFEAMVAGEMNASIECSPLLGPQAVLAMRDLRDGKKLPARIYTIEGIFDETNAAEALPTRQY
ncbi:MAG: LacI family transcriptional regulator [Spirochaetes bacterium RBG_16_67_19]|nr:MAG: LacI family transcriptional regulator [Spirochaetes bacterium RBG_16_67_19]